MEWGMPLFAPKPVPRRRGSSAPGVAGFTLIEVMVSVLILLVGLLGVVGMQMLSLQANRGAYFRSQAVYIGSEILDSMRSNPLAASSYLGVFPDDGGVSSIPADPGCATSASGCVPTAAAAQDLREWSRHFADIAPDPNAPGAFRPTIPGARALISANGDEYTVSVTWTERAFDNTDNDDGSATRSLVEQNVILRAVITP